MRVTSKKRPEKEKTDKGKSSFWEFLGGDFLLHPLVVRWYPYIILLFFLAAITVFNEKSVIRKTKKLDKLDREYKTTLSELKQNNEYIPYDEEQELIKILSSEGFVKDYKSVYKVPVKVISEEE